MGGWVGERGEEEEKNDVSSSGCIHPPTHPTTYLPSALLGEAHREEEVFIAQEDALGGLGPFMGIRSGLSL